MASFRKIALCELAKHEAKRAFIEDRPITSYFAENVFDENKMRRYMSLTALNSIQEAIKEGKKIDRNVADEIATAMKNWAIEKGVTHYTHLFQPLNGSTAEKHDAFIDVKDGKAFEKFTGKSLVQQEPDASSFPNGGLRNTFEARGYSAWDPNSPVFILDDTLCIPSVFVSYTGDALDMKVPHLRSISALSEAATAVVNLFDKKVSSVTVNIGLEQEYFLVDSSLYKARPDLKLCDRTVLGHTSAKDQQLSDHYFGAIPSRVVSFMKDFETEAYKLGIQLETRHNEVAPNQFECVPVFCDATKAIDQNMLLMIIMQKVADKHHLKVIFHEKPFDGVNGSGKHCNWSLQTDTKVNLLTPGKTPNKNLLFLAFYSSIVRAVHKYDLLLMSSICSLSNSYRLGGHEAPPAIMSIFSGSTLSKVFDSIMNMKDMDDDVTLENIKIANSIPDILTDNTDRNRTSPFAFTGNRFEFRALGASMNPAAATFVLNSVVAESLKVFKAKVDALENKGEERKAAVLTVIREFLLDSKDIMFEGNGYSKEWQEEAKKRGLNSITNVVEAFKSYIDDKNIDMFSKLGVLSRNEAYARYEVFNELYVKKLQIEARVLGDICFNHILPAAVNYRNTLLESIKSCKEVFGDEYKTICEADMKIYRKISEYVNSLSADVSALIDARKEANVIENMSQRAYLYSTKVKEYMHKVRYSADHLEMLIDDELWPLPKYRELLFF